MDHNSIKRSILNFKLGDCARGDQGYNRVLLQLFGFTGHGKSSFINSCKYVLDGEYKTIAAAGVKNGGSFTLERRSYELTDTVTMVDNRGFKYMSDFETLEVYAQLGNFCPLNEKVVWKEKYEDLMSMIEDADMNPNYVDFIVPIFVYSVPKQFHKNEESEMKNFLNHCRNMTGIFPIIVLTNKTSGDYVEVEKMFKCFGAEVVFAIENYTEKDHLETPGRHADILNILDNALKDVSFRMGIERDPKRERIEHKKFILQMAHEITLAEQREQDRQAMIEQEQFIQVMFEREKTIRATFEREQAIRATFEREQARRVMFYKRSWLRKLWDLFTHR